MKIELSENCANWKLGQVGTSWDELRQVGMSWEPKKLQNLDIKLEKLDKFGQFGINWDEFGQVGIS